MDTPTQFTRHTLIGVHNFRDFAGYSGKAGLDMKTGLLFRPGRLSELAVEDQATLQSIGPRLIIDLRRPSEARLAPTKADC